MFNIKFGAGAVGVGATLLCGSNKSDAAPYGSSSATMPFALLHNNTCLQKVGKKL
jgi:hypothetical protein